MNRLEIEILFDDLGKENRKKLIDIKKEIVSLFCQKELTISEANCVLSDLKMYFKYLEQEEINKTKVRHFERKENRI